MVLFIRFHFPQNEKNRQNVRLFINLVCNGDVTEMVGCHPGLMFVPGGRHNCIVKTMVTRKKSFTSNLYIKLKKKILYCQLNLFMSFCFFYFRCFQFFNANTYKNR